MAYIGNTQQNQNYVPAVDYFNGDGATVAFTLSRPVASVAQVQAVIENVPQNPGSAYTVSGNTITFTSAPPLGTSNIYVYYTSPNTQVVQPGQGTVSPSSLSTGGLYWDTIGNVGIGTSSPNAKLEVYGQRIRVNATPDPGIEFANTSAVKGYVFYDTTNDLMTMRHASSTGINLNSSGNVGIGTSSPVDLLTIYRSSGSGITSGISLQTAAGGVGDGSYIKWTGASTNEKIARIDGVEEGTDLGSIRFNTGNGADSFAERMRISNHDLTANSFISTAQHTNSNTEGVYKINTANTNYILYYPRRLTGLKLGYPLNKFDSQIRKADIFGGAELPITSISSDVSNPSTITVTTPYAHGLGPGTPIIVNITNSPSSGKEYAEGSFNILSIPSTTTFTYQAKTGLDVSDDIEATIYIRPSSFFVHRPFDGGVLIGSGTPHHGAMSARQSKKYFRYQSGKGLVWTSGTLLSTNFDVVNVSATGTAVSGNTISITTEVEHYLQIGANVRLSGVTTTGYEGYYRVYGITSDTAFTVALNEELGSSAPTLDLQPKLNLIGWHGGSVRAGIFDDQNGAFWENNGTHINVVLRSATFQLAGTVSMEVGSNYVTGDGNCRFLEQLKIYDRIVVRGMSHTVTSIINNNSLTVSPAWRGVSNQTRVKASRVIDQRIPQSQFNIDKVDGTGPSGYVLDASKMQMLLIQYTWYGAGFVDFGLRGPLGNYIMCHRIQNNNVNDEAYMRSGNLPVRYSANNEGPTARLSTAANTSVTTFTVDDASQFPAASVAYPFYVQVENEVVKVQGHTPGTNTFTNCTRGATFTLWQDGSSKSFTMGSATTHSANVGVTLLDCTSSPTLNHWGSAVIMDGGFDQDRGYAFTYARNNMALPSTAGAKSTVFLMRLAPSVSNTIIGDIGQRDLINRAQLILENMVVNVTGGRFVVEGILNPTNVTSNTIEWIDLNTENNGNQPSFTQFSTAFEFTDSATGGVIGALRNEFGGMDRSGIAPSTFVRYINYAKLGTTPGMTTSGAGTGANVSIWKTYSGTSTVNYVTTQIVVWEQGTGFAVGDTITVPGNIWTTSTTSTSYSGTAPTNNVTLTVLAVAQGVEGGERLFAIPVSTTNSGFLDLSKVKQIGTSAIPGNGIYPDGPEVLAINVTAITPGSAATGDFQITFSETQA